MVRNVRPFLLVVVLVTIPWGVRVPKVSKYGVYFWVERRTLCPGKYVRIFEMAMSLE